MVGVTGESSPAPQAPLLWSSSTVMELLGNVVLQAVPPDYMDFPKDF